MTDQPKHPPSTAPLPWALLGCALTAFAAAFSTGEHFAALPVLGLLLIAATLIRWRPPDSALLRWGLRGVIFTTIAMMVGLPTDNAAAWYFEPQYTNLFAYLLAGEMVVRAWQRADSARQSRAIFLFLSSLIIAAASNTYRRWPMQMFAPLYVLLAVLSLRGLDAMKPPAPIAPRAGTRLRGLLALRAVVLGIALGLGFAAVVIVTNYETRITTWAVDLLRESSPLPASSIGLSGSPHLSRVFNPAPSMSRVLLIDGTPRSRHLRMTAFDTYIRTQWQPALQDRPYTAVSLPSPANDAAARHLRLTRLAPLPLLLAMPSDAAAVESTGPLERDELGALRDREWRTRFSYDVQLQTEALDLVPLCPAPTAAQRARLLQLPPELDLKVIDLAIRVAGDGAGLTRLEHIAEHLRSTHRYSLIFDPHGEPLNDFILNNRPAHCQYFASAMVIMARAAGLPARLVTGFYAHEVYGDGRTVVRDRDAHAWAECWIDGRGWITADATPAGGLPDGLFAPPSSWQLFWERVKDAPGMLRHWLSGLPRPIVIFIAASTFALIALTLAIRTARKRSRAKASDHGAYAQPNGELAAAALRFNRWLRQRNMPCAAHRTWREHLAASSAATPAEIAICRGFVDAYDRARFGEVRDDAVFQLRERLDQLERPLKVQGGKSKQ